MRYLVDGYNVLHRILGGKLRRENLEETREKLLVDLLRFSSRKRPVTVYFDARIDPPRGVPRTGRKGSHVEIVFVPSADQAIRSRLRDADPAGTAVVSHDREVCGFAQAAGARVVRVIDFLDELYEKGDRDIDPLEPREKYGL